MYSGIETYFESGVLSADPIELIRMLYRGAVDAVEKARQHLREGDIAARSAQITKAGAIIAHLTFSVNRDVDPALAAISSSCTTTCSGASCAPTWTRPTLRWPRCRSFFLRCSKAG